MSQTAEQIIDAAMGRHFAFRDQYGIAVVFLNEVQRAILLEIVRTAEAFLGETEEIETQGTATLVAVDSFGVPFFTTTVQTGFAIRFDANGVPYVDTGDSFVSDPFGIDGGSPGLPLPDDLLRLISVSAMTTDSTIIPRTIEVVQPESVQKTGPRIGLRAFLTANRLVPVRQDINDVWSTVTSVRLNFVRNPTLSVLSDLITLPTSCIPAMTAKLAQRFATGSEKCSEADKRRFDNQAAEAMDTMLSSVNSLEGVTTSSVIYRR